MIRQTAIAYAMLLLLGTAVAGEEAPPYRLAMKTDYAIPVLRVGHEASLAVRVWNAGDAITVNLEAVVDTTGDAEQRWRRNDVVLPAGGHVDVPMALELKRFGSYRVAVTLRDAETQLKKELRFSYLDPVGPRPLPPSEGFWYGFDARVKNIEKTGWIPEAAALVGADYIRGGVNWPGIQPESADAYDWEKHKAVLGLVEKAGIKLMHSFCFTPPWAARPEYVEQIRQSGAAAFMLNRTPPRIDAFRSFVRAAMAVNHAHGQLFYDLWNEPDLMGFWQGTTDEYLEFMQAAHEEIKKVDPDAIVISGGIATLGEHRGHEKNPDLSRRSIVDGQAYYDAISLHQHGPFVKFQEAIDGPLADYRKQLKEIKPVWLTETGIMAVKGVSRMDQAEELVKKMAFARARNAIGFSWFVFSPSGGSDHMRYYAIMTHAFEPYPAYNAFNELVRYTRGLQFAENPDVGRGNWLLVFHGESVSTLVGWDENASTPGRKVLVQVPEGAQVSLVDVVGNRTPVAVNQGLVTWTLSKTVAYLRVEGGRANVIGAPAEFASAVHAVPGAECTATVKVMNPLPDAVEYELVFRKPDGAISMRTVPLAAGASATVTESVTVPFNAVKHPDVEVAWLIPDTPLQGTIRQSIHLPKTLKPGPLDGRTPDFVLDSPKQIVNLNEHDPSREAWTWNGPRDLSADIRLSLDGDTLLLGMDVRDNLHAPAGKPGQRDDVQVGLALSGQDSPWVIRLARGTDGTGEVTVESAPSGQATLTTKALTTKSLPQGISYLIRLPLTVLGVSREALVGSSTRVNIVVNDADDGGFEGYASLSGEIKNPAQTKDWAAVLFR